MPSALDRFIQQAVLQVLQERWDRTFSEHSYGFRPGRSAHQAVAQAQAYIAEGYRYTVDIDLEKRGIQLTPVDTTGCGLGLYPLHDSVPSTYRTSSGPNQSCDDRHLILLQGKDGAKSTYLRASEKTCWQDTHISPHPIFGCTPAGFAGALHLVVTGVN